MSVPFNDTFDNLPSPVTAMLNDTVSPGAWLLAVGVTAIDGLADVSSPSSLQEFSNVTASIDIAKRILFRCFMVSVNFCQRYRRGVTPRLCDSYPSFNLN